MLQINYKHKTEADSFLQTEEYILKNLKKLFIISKKFGIIYSNV